MHQETSFKVKAVSLEGHTLLEERVTLQILGKRMVSADDDIRQFAILWKEYNQWMDDHKAAVALAEPSLPVPPEGIAGPDEIATLVLRSYNEKVGYITSFQFTVLEELLKQGYLHSQTEVLEYRTTKEESIAHIVEVPLHFRIRLPVYTYDWEAGPTTSLKEELLEAFLHIHEDSLEFRTCYSSIKISGTVHTLFDPTPDQVAQETLHRVIRAAEAALHGLVIEYQTDRY